MNEDELVLTHHVGEVINVIQRTTHNLFDPDELLTVIVSSLWHDLLREVSFLLLLFVK